jgi:hypothetical protein
MTNLEKFHLMELKEKERVEDIFVFFTHFQKKQNFTFVKSKPLFPTNFSARAKNARFLTRAPTRTREKTVLFSHSKKNA